MTQSNNSIKLTIVYDDNPFDTRLKAVWGFGCLIEIGKTRVLFDAGGDSSVLLSNMTALGLDPFQVDAVVLSHSHNDHTDGLGTLLDYSVDLAVFAPRSFPEEYQTRVNEHNYFVPVSKPMWLCEHVRITGELGQATIEQSLVIETDKGLIVVTGCAHPGIVEIVRAAKAYGNVYLILGGFHLKDKSVGEVEDIIAELKRLGVHKVAPCHRTGEQAIRQLKAAFGTNFVQVGVGTVFFERTP